MKIFQNAKIIGPGIDASVYLRQENKRGDKEFIMSRSDLMEFALNPRRWLAGYKSEETRSTEWGQLIDALVLEPAKFSRRFEIYPATYEVNKMQCPVCKSETDAKSCSKCKVDRIQVRTSKEWNNNSTLCEEWVKKQGGKICITEEKYQDALNAVTAINNEPDISELIDASAKQMMVMAEYHDNNGLIIPVKGLLDMVPNVDSRFGKSLADFKTSFTANPALWPKLVSKHNYDAQASLFFDLWNAASGEEPRVDFVHVVQENVFPFEVMSPMAVLSSEFLELGRTKYVSALRKYAKCLTLDPEKWPSYQTAPRTFGHAQIIEPDAWAVTNAANQWQDIEEPKQLATATASDDLIP